MKIKSVLSIILSVLMIASVCSAGFTAQAADSAKISSGDTRDGVIGECKWEYNFDNKQLTISGDGKMGTAKDYEYPWQYFDIDSVVIKNGVKSISESAFYSCAATTVTIGNTVELIGNSAFRFCQKLTDVDIPSSVKTISSNAFDRCDSLKTATLHNGLEVIDSCAFSDCAKLESISLPDSVKEIGVSAFNGCTNLSTIDFPSGEFTIEANAFDGTAWYNNQPDGIIYFGTTAYALKGR